MSIQGPTVSGSDFNSNAQHADQFVSVGSVRVDIRFIAPVFISILLLVGQITFGLLESYSHTLSAIAASILTEIILGLIVFKKVPHLASAYVSGISVGILVRSVFFWPFIFCGIISILSKYVFRWHGRHIWNPSNFGIAMMILLASQAMSTLGAQWGNSLVPMIIVWILGSIIVMRLKRFHICVAYVASFVVFAVLRSVFNGQPVVAELAPITGPMYQLFIFFMITDPKSTVKTRNGQILVAVCVAAMESVMRVFQNIHAPYFALFTVGPIAVLIEIWWSNRRQTRNVLPITA